MEAIMPLGASASISEENAAQSTFAECTSFEVESNSPEGSVDGADTLSPTSRVPLGWVGGVLQPLPSVAPRPTMWRGLGAGDGVWSQSGKEVHYTCQWDLRTLLAYSKYQTERGWGRNSSNGNILFGTISRGCYNPPMMIPSGNLKEVLDLLVHPYDTGPRAPE